jgi:hypothetical protein
MVRIKKVLLWDQDGFGMPELERPQAEGLHGKQHHALFLLG